MINTMFFNQLIKNHINREQWAKVNTFMDGNFFFASFLTVPLYSERFGLFRPS